MRDTFENRYLSSFSPQNSVFLRYLSLIFGYLSLVFGCLSLDVLPIIIGKSIAKHPYISSNLRLLCVLTN